jgi:hypothetical protein
MLVASERFPSRFSPYRRLCALRSFEHPFDNEFPDDPAVPQLLTMISNDRRARLRWTVPATAYFLAASCAGNSSSPIVPDLLAGSQVCLAMDWGSGSRPDFFGWTAPDTVVLLTKSSEPRGNAHLADAEGLVGVAASQPDGKGGGWIWWTRSDTLWISSQSPTMDDLVIQAGRPIGRTSASWNGVGMASNERGDVELQPYACGGPSRHSRVS